MSSKKGDLNLLIPGADGWEIWTGSNSSGYTLRTATEATSALEVTGYPSGGVGMAVPVRQLTAVPFRAQTNDLALLGDLAAMQLEKNGTRPALDGGQLTDHFVYSTSENETNLTAVVMSSPNEGQLPRRSPEGFDISPRCYPLPEGQVVVWRELGRWVFGIGKPGQALYFQCLSGEFLDDRAGNEIRLALTQLQIQGLISGTPESAVIWAHESSSDARSEEVEALSRGLGVPVHVTPKPAPTWPSPPSHLLPADVRAERLAVKGKRNRNLLIAAVCLAYVGIGAYLYLDLQKAKDATIAAKRKVNEVKADADFYEEHEARWAELGPIVDVEYYPFEVMLAAYQALPNTGSERFIRVKNFTVKNQMGLVNGEDSLIREVYITGYAEEVNQEKIPEYAESLRKSNALPFTWECPPETRDKKTGQMTFKYVGNDPLTQTAP